MKRRSSGFTLIELLVVISIITILAGMLMPVYSSARGSARQIVCVSNQKQFATAIIMYADSYDERLPPGVGEYWFDAIQPFVRNYEIFGCRQARIRSKDDIPTYFFNINVAGESMPRVEAIYHSASDAILTGDYTRTGPTDPCLIDPATIAGTPPEWAQRHRNGAVYSYLDGHARWRHSLSANW